MIQIATVPLYYSLCLDLSKYFDTLNHDMLMNMLREDIKDKVLIDLIKKYLKSGVMENGIVTETEEGSPQGGNLSPLLANIYLDRFDKEYESRAVSVYSIRNFAFLALHWECPNGRHTETETLVKAIGLLQAAEYSGIPLQMKDLHAGDILIYPKRTSLCTIYD